MNRYNKIIIIALVSVVAIARIHLGILVENNVIKQEEPVHKVKPMGSMENEKSLAELIQEALDELEWETTAEETIPDI